jgi:plastocyanin
MIAPSSLFDIGRFDDRRGVSRSRRYRTTIVAALALVGSTAFAATLVHTVAQKGRDFSLHEILIARGDSIRFTNEDEFLHQIYVDSKDMFFDSAEQPPGQAIDVNFPQAGTFAVRCHIHPKMLLSVRVE